MIRLILWIVLCAVATFCVRRIGPWSVLEALAVFSLIAYLVDKMSAWSGRK
jgi:branched-subunit amino acid transport protein AzlD